jgi:hypothetical protein
MTPEQRKTRTEALLKEKGIPFFSGLPCIEFEDDTELQTPEEVGIRIACLFCVVGCAFCQSDAVYKKHRKKYLKKHQLWDRLSSEEHSFLSDPAPDRLSINQFTWRSEALFLLMWAVGLFGRLPWPDHQTETSQMVAIFPDLAGSPWSFIFNLELRSKPEILDASDLLYRLHWATTQAQLDGQPSPGGLHPGVVYEWHYAINWITKHDDSDWDRVSTDT